MKKLIVGATLAAALVLALGTTTLVGTAAADEAPAEASDAAVVEAGAGDEAACRQWCSRKVCNDRGECWVTYYCCG